MKPTYHIDPKSDGTWLIIQTEKASAMLNLEHAFSGNAAALRAVRLLGDFLYDTRDKNGKEA